MSMGRIVGEEVLNFLRSEQVMVNEELFQIVKTLATTA